MYLSVLIICLLTCIALVACLPEWKKKTFHVHCYHTEAEPSTDICLSDKEYLAISEAKVGTLISTCLAKTDMAYGT